MGFRVKGLGFRVRVKIARRPGCHGVMVLVMQMTMVMAILMVIVPVMVMVRATA